MGSFTHKWWVDDLSPGETQTEKRSLELSIPEGLELCRWAKIIYDSKPAWFYLTGAESEFDELAKAAEEKCRK